MYISIRLFSLDIEGLYSHPDLVIQNPIKELLYIGFHVELYYVKLGLFDFWIQSFVSYIAESSKFVFMKKMHSMFVRSKVILNNLTLNYTLSLTSVTIFYERDFTSLPWLYSYRSIWKSESYTWYVLAGFFGSAGMFLEIRKAHEELYYNNIFFYNMELLCHLAITRWGTWKMYSYINELS